MRQWNVVATMSGLLVFIYAAGCIYALVTSQIDFKDFAASILAVMLPTLGYLARMLQPETP
jgi:hypothetical protein